MSEFVDYGSLCCRGNFTVSKERSKVSDPRLPEAGTRTVRQVELRMVAHAQEAEAEAGSTAATVNSRPARVTF